MKGSARISVKLIAVIALLLLLKAGNGEIEEF